MNRRHFLRRTAAALPAAFLPACQNQRKRPLNFLFILADDLGWSQTGCYGSTFYETPHIDRLAAEGLRFTDAYAACPVCSPTRAGIMTGKYPARLHLTDFIPGNPFPDRPLVQPEWTKYLKLEETTLAERLRQAGYATANFGKWHLSKTKRPPESEPWNPHRQGFDEYMVTYKPARSQDPENDAHNVAAITQKAVDFMQRNKDRPFFLYVTHNSIHDPLMEKKSLVEKYRAKDGSEKPQNTPVVGAMIETLDHSVGTLLAKLEQLGLSDNTVVIFFSDNGGLARDAAQTPLRGGKATLWEGGIRVPFIVRWPGVVRPGTKCAVPVISTDFYPTILEIAGIGCGNTADGKSLLPLLTGAGELERDAIYWHYPHYHTAGDGPSGAVRLGDYKLIERYEKSLRGAEGAFELYFLKQDPAEQDDLAAKMPEKTRTLADRLHAWRVAVKAQMPVVR